MRSLLTALLLLPAVGFSQTLNLTVSGNPVAKNAGGCADGVAGAWTGTGLTAACSTLQIWLSATNACGEFPITTTTPPDLVVGTAQAGDLDLGTATGTFTFAFNVLPSFSLNTCGTNNIDFTNYLCAAVRSRSGTGTCDGTLTTAASVAIRYDTIPPQPPAVSVTPLDGKLSVNLTTADTDVVFFNVDYAVAPDDGGTPTYSPRSSNITASGGSGAVTISPLINGVTYLVRGYSTDEATNGSVASDPVSGSPEVTLGFFTNYVNDGGLETGGCAAAGGGPAAVALTALLLLAVARRRG